jgi:sterol desaturase/sphingolipid hydroxylase (fatty acid hydroxylase superfamily)
MSEEKAPSRNREAAMRIFKSDFMEFFTHIHPAAVLAVWVPLTILAAYAAISNLGSLWWLIFPMVVLGVLFWSLLEYVLHRFLFHYHPKSEIGKRISFMFHGVHHDQPMVKTRLVMPPIVSLPLGAFVYGFFLLTIWWPTGSFGLTNALATGTFIGYILYDMTHYATHHFNIKAGWFKWIRSHHMKHHVQTPDMRFGVTSPLWDYLFGTEPKENSGKSGPTA